MTSALDIAKYFQSSFLTELQGLPIHQLPKTISIVDLDKFWNSFLFAWEALSKELTTLLTNGDPEIAVKLDHARSTAFTFFSVKSDDESVDVYDFMEQLKVQCPAGSSTTLGSALDAAMAAYIEMFIERDIGENTPSRLNGMGVFWPSKDYYFVNQESLHEKLYKNSDFSTLSAPEWLDFLWTFYGTAASPTGGASGCSVSSDTSVTLNKNQLMISPTVGNIHVTLNAHAISMEIARTVDTMYIGFGADFTPLLSSARFRHLHKSAARRLRAHPEQQVKPSSMRDPRLRKMRALQFTYPSTYQFTYPPTYQLTYPLTYSGPTLRTPLRIHQSSPLPIHRSLCLPTHCCFLIAPTLLFESIFKATDAIGTRLTTHPVAPPMVFTMAQTRARRKTIAVSAWRLPTHRSLGLPTHQPSRIHHTFCYQRIHRSLRLTLPIHHSWTLPTHRRLPIHQSSLLPISMAKTSSTHTVETFWAHSAQPVLMQVGIGSFTC